jgi:hypothetical protein
MKQSGFSVGAACERTLRQVKVSDGGWASRHMAAIRCPLVNEAPILGMLRMLADYADAHCRRYEAPIAHDGMLGAAWLDMLRGARVLLNGELGRLDAGTLDATVGAWHSIILTPELKS